jgi:hypothetical protein
VKATDIQRICQLVEFQALQHPEKIALVDAQGVEISWNAYQASVCMPC